MSNEVIPLYRPGADVTCSAAKAVTGGTFVEVAGDLSDGLPSVQPVSASTSVAFGVAAYDAAKDANVAVIRGSKVILSVAADGSSTAITAGDQLDVNTSGKAVKHASGVVAAVALVGTTKAENILVSLV